MYLLVDSPSRLKVFHMADVAQKAIAANGVKNGTIMVKSGGAPTRFQTINPTINQYLSAADMETKWGNRFDNSDFHVVADGALLT